MNNLGMDKLKAGYTKFLRGTERLSERVGERLVEALHVPTQAGSHMVDYAASVASMGGRQHVIGVRTVQEERQISEGGFAFVWRVRDVNSHEGMALKKILCQDKKALAMARREVAVLERLPPHPNIVRYFGAAEVHTETRAREVCLLFELCAGGHLLDLLERNGDKLSEELILSTFKDVCCAVAALHGLEPPIQHRDLKVENILLGSDGKFKLCDFGSWSDERTDPAVLDKVELGKLQEHIERYTTMMYRPPEMVDFYQQFSITEQVDIWMLGCILYTLMFCRHPFQDESTLAIANARYRMMSTPRYSDRLLDLTHWLLAQDPGNRPRAAQLLNILEHFEEGAPLPLPTAVVEKKAQQLRLYSADGDAGAKPRRRGRDGSGSHGAERSPSSPKSSGASEKTSDKILEQHGERGQEHKIKAGSHTRHKRHHRSSNAGSGGAENGFFAAVGSGSATPWGQPPGSSAAAAGGTLAQEAASFWPAAAPSAAAEPSCSWANFDAFGAAAGGSTSSAAQVSGRHVAGSLGDPSPGSSSRGSASCSPSISLTSPGAGSEADFGHSAPSSQPPWAKNGVWSVFGGNAASSTQADVASCSSTSRPGFTPGGSPAASLGPWCRGASASGCGTWAAGVGNAQEVSNSPWGAGSDSSAGASAPSAWPGPPQLPDEGTSRSSSGAWDPFGQNAAASPGSGAVTTSSNQRHHGGAVGVVDGSSCAAATLPWPMAHTGAAAESERRRPGDSSSAARRGESAASASTADAAASAVGSSSPSRTLVVPSVAGTGHSRQSSRQQVNVGSLPWPAESGLGVVEANAGVATVAGAAASAAGHSRQSSRQQSSPRPLPWPAEPAPAAGVLGASVGQLGTTSGPGPPWNPWSSAPATIAPHQDGGRRADGSHSGNATALPW
eukprot:TRINITY_DN9955_c0_g1_i1.p1 TRINITY_DN9955_c0_g1~~TRINITY_DN9955_c0_g1_i1.p1  ORF type:complete len:1031 (-),score=190.69 TRINITY_DN9955_c0_g1_i1:99-2795(-)